MDNLACRRLTIEARVIIIIDNISQVIWMTKSNGSCIAQKYIEHCFCYNGMEVDWRVYVMIRQATPGKPELFIHNRVFFRIASQIYKFSSTVNFVEKQRVFIFGSTKKPGKK